MRVAGIVVAAGRSERYGGGVPKQLLDLGGRSLLERAVEALAGHPGIGGVIVVLPPALLDGPLPATVRSWPGVAEVVPGGDTRAASAARGVTAAASRGAEHVLVHDAARPLVPAAVVERVVEATLRHGAAVPVLRVPDTVKEDDGAGCVRRTLDRERLRLAQTPQGARTDWLAEALAAAEAAGDTVTDEAAALERAGRRVVLVEGDPANVKITTPDDLARARAVLALGGAMADLRVGTGFDVHRFGTARTLVLCGVAFPGEPGLAGHSDADVVLHAAMDAVLGGAGLPDIGAHFPPGEPAWKDADSVELASRVRTILDGAGYEIVNLDLTVLAERPRIRERVEEMRARAAGAFGLEPHRVGLKATTLEGIGGLGRGEGIACQAVALLRRRTGAA